jgi:uncharacterized repeat protein (TIGR03843 family)
VDLLRDGDISVEGRLVEASNATLYCAIAADGTTAPCVYKPVMGERPLWDFPDGTLAGREYASYVLSTATGWDIVPPTVLRDGPFGPGMVQLWIEVDETVDLSALIRTDLQQLRHIALFDAIANNADRKGGHLLPTADGHIFGCDHGLTFHAENKLRTVLWGWRGDPFTDAEIDVLLRLDDQLTAAGDLCAQLEPLLTAREVTKTAQRIRRLLKTGVFPQPSGDWPAVPWPPF